MQLYCACWKYENNKHFLFYLSLTQTIGIVHNIHPVDDGVYTRNTHSVMNNTKYANKKGKNA